MRARAAAALDALLDVLHLALLGVRSRRARTALSAVGIAIGVATTVLVTGIPAAGARAVRAELDALGTGLLRVQPVSVGQPASVPLPPDAPAMAARIGPVTAVSAVANTHVQVARSDLLAEEWSGLSVLAAQPGLLELLDGRMASGRFLDAVTSRFPVAVLGSAAARRLGVPAAAAGRGQQVFLDGRWFTVVGVMAPLPLAEDLDRAVLVGWEAAQERLGFDASPTVVYVQTPDAAVEAVRAVLPATVNPRLPGTVQVSRPSDALAARRVTESAFGALLTGLAAVAVLVGAVGVANTMVVSVVERRREIGLRRALGATRAGIAAQFLAESVALSGLGGALGTVLGVGATLAWSVARGWPPEVPLTTVAAAGAGSLLVGALAGAYPSLRAARLAPTEALSAP